MSVIDSAGSPRQSPPPGRTAEKVAAQAAEAGHPGSHPSRLTDVVALLRPEHAAKSLLLVPFAFVTAAPWTLGAFTRDAWATLAFVVASACVYVGNDIADRDRDRAHPAKRARPIASGRVPVPAACLCCLILAGVLAAIITAGPRLPYWPVLVYLAVNVAYSRVLKHIPLIDVSTVALGYVLRVVQGYAAVGTSLPGWLLVAVFALALTLVLGKRRHELLQVGAVHRPALRGYSVELVNHLLQVTCVLAVVAGLLSLRSEAPFGPDGQAAMLVSAPFAIFALFRYLKLVFVDQAGGDPVRTLLRDPVVVGTSVLWAAVLAATLAIARYPGLTHTMLR